MADPAQIDIIADRRVDHFETWSFLGVDWTGSTFKMQVRATKDTTGTPLLEHSTATGSFAIFFAGTATVAAHVAAERLTSDIYGLVSPVTGVNYAASDDLLLSQISLGIADVVLSAFPFPEERGGDWQGWHDIVRSPPSGSNEIIMRGQFIVRAGVTIS